MKRQIILDTETTRLYPDQGDRLIEFAGVEMIDRRFTGNNLHLYVNPERDIAEEAVAVHGITLDKLTEMNAPLFARVGGQIADFLRDAELVIHNAPFDVGFLNMEFGRMGLPSITNVAANVVDTLKMAREMYPGQKNSLDALCTRLDVDRSKRVLHGALIDCELLGEVYLAMTRNQFSLVDELMGTSDSSILSADGQRSTPLVGHPPLLVVAPSADDMAAHEAYLTDLDKIVEGACVWRGTGRHEGAEHTS